MEILLAPNGKPSNLSPEQYKLVRTPEFIAWFGNWLNDPENASKVVDENGEPLPVYHGTQKEFNVFNVNPKERVTLDWNTSLGIHFSESKIVAEKFSEGLYSNNKSKGVVKEVFLNLKNPKTKNKFISKSNKDKITKKQEQNYNEWKRLRDEYDIKSGLIGQDFDLSEIIKEKGISQAIKIRQDFIEDKIGKQPILKYEKQDEFRYDEVELLEELTGLDYFSVANMKVKERYKIGTNIRLELLNNGFDGIIYINSSEKENIGISSSSEAFIVFNSNQIKLADGTNTTFDGNNPDIRFDGGGNVNDEIETFYERTYADGIKTRFSVEEYEKNIYPNLLLAEGGGVKATTERFRPTETVNFNPPLIGTNGNKLVSYTWKYDYVVDVKEGEDISKRVSDWTQAETNAETGRDIVHVFDILDTNGKLSSVSSESVPVALGFITKDQKKSFINLATSAKTLAKQQLQLSILKAKNKEIEKARQEIIDAGYPEITYPESSWNNIDEDDLYMKMGEVSVVGYKSKPNDPERLSALKFSYINSEMKKRGLITRTYDTYDLEQRIKRQEQKVQRLAELKPELFKGGGDVKEVLLAPNGKPSNLSKEQYELVRSKPFISWFGDWLNDPENASKVLDKNGEPLVCFHGSRSDFTVFDKKKGGASNSTAQIGFWFTPKESFARNFSENTWYGKNKETTVYSVFLLMKNPKIYKTEKEDPKIANELREKISELESEVRNLRYKWSDDWRENHAFYYASEGMIKDENLDKLKNQTPNSEQAINDGYKAAEINKEIKLLENKSYELFYSDSYEKLKTDIYKIANKTAKDANIGGLGMALGNSQEITEKYVESLKKQGFDGVIVEKTRFDRKEAGGVNDQYVVFEPEHIKLADGTNTTFDLTNPDIRFAGGGGVSTLLAPNGKPSNLTPEQYKLVREPSFLAWFGNWMDDPQNSSKVIDENGEPLVCYHGTSAKFNVFRDVDVERGAMGDSVGFYFTPNKFSAIEWTENGDYLEVFLNIKNIYKLKKFSNDDDFIEILGDELKSSIGLPERAETYWYLKNGSAYDGREEYNVGSVVKELSLKKGIEGYYFTEYISKDIGIVPVYMVFESKNVKLADGTNTTFDSNNPDIRFDGGGNVNDESETFYERTYADGIKTRFSVEEYEKNIYPNSPILLAPNGKPSNLNAEQYKLVRSEPFKKFFGDWEKLALAKINDSGIDDISLKRLEDGVSKVVDENGEPLVCYHGTDNKFHVFDKSKIGDNHWQSKSVYGGGFFFTDKKNKAFSGIKYEVFLNIKKPLINTFSDKYGYEADYYDATDNFDLNSTRYFQTAKENRNNGIIIKTPRGSLYVAFQPKQIKLADGTNTTFDVNNPDIRYEEGGFVSYKDKLNKKFGYPKDKSHNLEQISKDTNVSLKGLQQIYNKGIGAFKTNPSSVRPTVKSKEQWAMARVYSAVMGGKAAKIDSNELKMKTGGEVPDNYIYVVNNFGSGEVLNKVFNEWKNIQSEKDQSDWGMRTKLLRFGTYGQFDLFYVMEKFDFDKSDKINGILKRDFKKEVQNAYDNKITFDGGGDVESSDWDNLEERGAAEVTIKLNEFLKANGLNTKVNLSKTSFGRSQYIYATDLTNEFPDESNAVKIRISDHSVSNFDRMFNEVHLDLKNTEYNEALGQYILAKVRFKIGRLRKEYFTHEIVTLPETKRLETTNLTDKDVIISESLTKKGKPMYWVERTNYKRFNQYTYIPTGKIFETIPVDEIEEKRKKERAELAELKERMDNDIEVNDFLRQKYKEGKVVRTLERTYDNLETFKRKHPDYEFIEQRDLGGGAYKYFFMREKDGNNQHTQYDPNYQLWLKENIINKNNEMEKENKTFGGGGGVNTPKNDPNDIYIKAVESITGQGIETDSLRIEGNNVYFKYKNKTYELSLNKKQVDDTISVNRKFLDMRQRYAGGGGVAAKSSHTLNSSKGKIAINLNKKWSDIEILLVPISFLAKCSEFNRRNDPKYSLEDSAKNIENIKKSFVKNGITEPLILSYVKNESKLLLLEGNHRLNALIELEVPYYPVCVTTIDSWSKGKGKGVKTKIKPYFVTEIGRDRYTSVDNFEGVPFVNMENNHVDVNETDTLTINVPLLIRLFEYIREDVDNDAQIHFLTENLLKLKDKPELSMIDYDSIIDGIKIKKTAEKILALGGLAEGPPHSKGGIPLVVKSTGQNIEIEGGELVVNKFSSSETEKFEFEGKELTPCEIVSELNSMDNNGVEIDCNKIVGRFKK
jgi:hypothetical protein